MEALGASHLKVFVSRLREKEGVGFAPTRHEYGFLVRRKGVGFRANCIASISSASSSQKDLGNEGIQRVNLDQPKTVRVRFRLQKQCEFGEQFLLVGDDPNLGLWDPVDGVPLIWSEGHIWTAEVDVPSSKVINYKFILEEIDGSVSWQPGPDRVLEAWDTAKIISVSEDWDRPDFQEVVEEEFVNGSSLLVGGESLVEGGNGVMVEEMDASSLGLLVDGTLNEGIVEEEDTKEEVDALLLMVAENISEVPESRSEMRLAMDEEAPALVPGLDASPLKEAEEEDTEISDSTQKKDEIVKDTAAEFVAIEDSRHPTQKKNSIVEDSAAEINEIKDSSDPTRKKNSIVEDAAIKFDRIEGSTDLNKSNDDILEDTATQPKIHVSAALHYPETRETRVTEKKKTRQEGKSHMLDIDMHMQWGRRTLHKFLANLGFIQHS